MLLIWNRYLNYMSLQLLQERERFRFYMQLLIFTFRSICLTLNHYLNSHSKYLYFNAGKVLIIRKTTVVSLRNTLNDLIQ